MHRDSRESLETMVTTELTAKREKEGHRETEETMAKLVRLELKESLEPTVWTELLEPQEQKDPMESPGKRETKDHLGLRDLKDQKVFYFMN